MSWKQYFHSVHCFVVLNCNLHFWNDKQPASGKLDFKQNRDLNMTQTVAENTTNLEVVVWPFNLEEVYMDREIDWQRRISVETPGIKVVPLFIPLVHCYNELSWIAVKCWHFAIKDNHLFFTNWSRSLWSIIHVFLSLKDLVYLQWKIVHTFPCLVVICYIFGWHINLKNTNVRVVFCYKIWNN